MNFKSIEDIIEYATEKEKEAVDFYTDLSKQEVFAGAKKTFEEFASEEKKHQTMLENFGNNKEKLAGYEYKWIPDMKRSDYMVEITYEPSMHFTDVLRLAMKREEKALKLYNDLMGQSDNDEFVKLFKMLCQEEAKHKLALETLYDDYMAGQGD